MIHNAKIKKSYTKIKKRELSKNPEAFDTAYLTEVPESKGQELHPERQAMLKEPEALTQQDLTMTTKIGPSRKRRHAVPFQKETEKAQQRRQLAEMRRKEIEQSQQQRQQKLEERERFRKAMAKARVGGRNGQRKLGRESKVLLEKVKKIMGD